MHKLENFVSSLARLVEAFLDAGVREGDRGILFFAAAALEDFCVDRCALSPAGLNWLSLPELVALEVVVVIAEPVLGEKSHLLVLLLSRSYSFSKARESETNFSLPT